MTTPVLTQRTIRRPATVRGFGYLSGQDVVVEFHPAAADSGLRFVRTDLPERPTISVRLENRVDAERRTVLASGDVRVEMVEHVLAALVGLGIDNCEIRTSAAELPCGDGSAIPFVEALDDAGRVDLGIPRQVMMVAARARVGDHGTWIEARPTITGGLTIEYHLDYGPAGPIGPQSISVEATEEVFRTELAPCRTFLLREEADAMRAAGIGRRVTPENLLVLDQDGPVDNTLRFPDECARHKAVDVMGDLALIGRPILGHIVACRSGHRLNAALGRALLQQRAAVLAEVQERVA
jgi:UDP-3-O-acyl N-acetylglucosamine deacetylase